ncbi:MAG TPA: 6-carboxytetrahydropterin synthase [Bacteroidales bacterium]|nr:6-carboxytetrahydropterin synthase [Bacteroidales bacterium]
MAKIRVTKRFKWEMSHALHHYDGLCRNLHGHSYIMYATVIGTPTQDKSDPKYGMVLDFGDFKRLVHEEIVDRFDHSVALSDAENYKALKEIKGLFNRIHILPYQPTCENMVEDFAHRIMKKLPDGVDLHSLRLYETATSYAEWFAEDQK